MLDYDIPRLTDLASRELSIRLAKRNRSIRIEAKYGFRCLDAAMAGVNVSRLVVTRNNDEAPSAGLYRRHMRS